MANTRQTLPLQCSAMAAILQSAQWTTFWSYFIDRWAVGIWLDWSYYSWWTSKGEVRNMIYYGESFIKMIYFHCKSCISQVNKKIGLTPLIALIWISCSFCIWWKRLKYKVSNKLRWRYNYYKISNICYLAIYYTILISTVQQCSAHGGCTSRASASVVVVELVVVKWITSALCYRSHLTRHTPLARSCGSTGRRVAR